MGGKTQFQLCKRSRRRKVYCPHCNKTVDRVENVALDILSAGLQFNLRGVADEALKGNHEGEAKKQAIPGVDATQLSLQQKTWQNLLFIYE